MNIQVGPHLLEITNRELTNENELNVNKCYFTFSEEYTADLVKVAVFLDSFGNCYQKAIINNECDIPYIENNGTCSVGVYAFSVDLETGAKTIQYSPSPRSFKVLAGSYIGSDEEITASQFEQYMQALNNGLNEVKEALEQITHADEEAIEIINNFENNVSEYTRTFDTNAESKTNDFNANANEKIETVNTIKSNVEDIEGNIEGLKNQIDTTVNNFNINAANKLSEYNSNASEKTTYFNTNANEKTTAINEIYVNAEELVEGFDDNVANKTSNFNTNAETKTTIFNSNVSSKTNEFNTNANEKTSTFNTNATNKTSDFDTNAESKTEAFNDNYDAAIANFNANADSIEKKLSLNSKLRNALPKVTGTGTEITLNDTAEAEMMLELSGNTTQNTVILPDSHTQVDYIEATDGQFIITNYTADTTKKITYKTEIMWNDIQTRQNMGADYGLFIGVLNGIYRIGTKETSLIPSTTSYDKIIANYDIPNNAFDLTVNGQTESGTRTNWSSLQIRLFTILVSGSNQGYCNCKMKYFEIYEDDVLVKRFIPCFRNSDNVIGMYDTINNGFYTNLGSGVFEKGDNSTLPNPTFPQDVINVTGENNVKIANGNNTQNQTFPITLGNIEVCKIDNYKDFFFKNIPECEYYDSTLSLNKWYLKKNISKVVLNGGETGWNLNTDGTYGDIFSIKYNDIGINDLIKKGNGISTSPRIPRICDYFSTFETPSSYKDCPIGHLGYNSKTFIDLFFMFGVSRGTFADIDSWLTWLSNNNITIYYVLNISKNVLLNDTLQEQLDNIMYAYAYQNQTNISQENDGAPFIIDAEAVADVSKLITNLTNAIIEIGGGE